MTLAYTRLNKSNDVILMKEKEKVVLQARENLKPYLAKEFENENVGYVAYENAVATMVAQLKAEK